MSIGLMILVIGIVCVLVSGIMFFLFLKKDWEVSVDAFDQKFAHESNLKPAKMGIEKERKQIAAQLNIKSTRPVHKPIESDYTANSNTVTDSQTVIVDTQMTVLDDQTMMEETEKLI